MVNNYASTFFHYQSTEKAITFNKRVLDQIKNPKSENIGQSESKDWDPVFFKPQTGIQAAI